MAGAGDMPRLLCHKVFSNLGFLPETVWMRWIFTIMGGPGLDIEGLGRLAQFLMLS